MATAKKDVAALIDNVRNTPGWEVTTNDAGHWVFTNTVTGERMTMSPTPSNIPSVKGRLKRLGWDPDAAEMAREEKRVAAMAAEREREARMLTSAEEHAAKVLAEEQAAREREAAARAAETAALRAQARQLSQEAKAAKQKPVPVQPPTPLALFGEVATTPVAQPTIKKTPVHPPVNPLFMSPSVASPALVVPSDEEAQKQIGRKILAACRTERIFVGKEWAEAALDLEEGACRQRHVYDTNVATIQRDIEKGDFYGNPADHLVFDEHGCLVNGQHRCWAIVYADPEKFAQHYPNGVEVYVAYGFDSRFCHIFDSGKNRTVTDSLAVDNVIGFGDSHAAALRNLMNFDFSFTLDRDDPRRKWRNWPKNIWTKADYTVAAKGPYQRLPEYSTLASHVFKKGGAVHTSVATAAFLFDRDNPNGSKKGTNKDFWAGVCFEVTLAPDDPRGALYKYFQNARAEKNKPSLPGLTQLAQILRQYANFHIGEPITQVQTAYDAVMPPVWQEDFRWFSSDTADGIRELRKSKYPSRIPARLKGRDTES